MARITGGQNRCSLGVSLSLAKPPANPPRRRMVLPAEGPAAAAEATMPKARTLVYIVERLLCVLGRVLRSVGALLTEIRCDRSSITHLFL